MKIKFAQIDARDNAYTGYHPIGAVVEKQSEYQGKPITYYDRAWPLSAKDKETMCKAEIEYLSGVEELQKRIVEKYEPLLVGGDPADDDTLDEIYKRYEDQLDKFWPDLYYT